MDDQERQRVKESLREYEARIEPHQQPGSMELFRPFGPLLARVTVPRVFVDRINQYVDDFLRSHGDPPESGEPPTVGTFDLPATFVEEGEERSLGRFLAQVVARYVSECERAHGGSVEFERFWIVRHVEGSFSPVHFHSTDVAAVLYLKVPAAIREAAGEGKNYLTARKAGHITFLTGGRQPFSKSFASVAPVEGELILSPGWLLHAVEPFQGPGERRSMAFNATVR